MKLIDADLLGLTDMEIIMCDGDYKEALKMLIDKIEHAPTIEPEPQIIRCRDCEWWTKQQDSIQGRCARYGMYPTGEWFCGNAERRQEWMIAKS